MRTSLALVFVLSALGLACLASPTIDAIVVAEQTDRSTGLPPPTRENPSYYVAFDAGYIEAGQPIAGLKPPAAATIGAQLKASLASVGYEQAPAQKKPSLALIYHWGSIRPKGGFGGSTAANLQARITLVTPTITAHRTMLYLNDGKESNAGYITSDVRNNLELARGDHYFVIVSAYDYASVAQQKPLLLWRVKISTPQNSGPMAEVLSALVGSCGPFVDKTFDYPQIISASRLPAPSPEILDRQTQSYFTPGKLDTSILTSLMKQEHGYFSGELVSSYSQSHPALPPVLTQRIASYRQEKAALQSILMAKLKPLAPGPETSHAIDTFNSEYSSRIAALEESRVKILTELAGLKTTRSFFKTDCPLDVLLQEFTDDVKQLENASVKAPQ